MRAICSSIRRTRTPDGGILLDVARGQMFSLNAIGSTILDLLEAGNDEERIAEHLSVVCDTDLDVVRFDVREFLENLSQQHILQQSTPTPTNDREAADDDSAPI